MQIAAAGRFNTDQKFLDFCNQMLEKVRTVPGVEAAGTSHFLPLGRVIPGTGFWRADQPFPGHGSEPVTEVLVVMPGYFAAMNIPLIRGRVLTERDRAGAPFAVVVNQTLVRQFYPNEDPIGKRIYLQWNHPKETYEVVGVVGDVRQKSLDKDPKPGVFLSNLEAPTGPINLVVRTHGDPKQLASAIRSEIHSLDREIPIADVKTMDEYVSESVAAPRFNTILLGGFAVLALVLAAVGLYGVLSYIVTASRTQIGIRLALGARPSTMFRMITGRALALAAAGVALGALGCIALRQVLAALLFGIGPSDPVTIAAAVGVLLLVAAAAAFFPALRAMRTDPMTALREE